MKLSAEFLGIVDLGVGVYVDKDESFIPEPVDETDSALLEKQRGRILGITEPTLTNEASTNQPSAPN